MILVWYIVAMLFHDVVRVVMVVVVMLVVVIVMLVSLLMLCLFGWGV